MTTSRPNQSIMNGLACLQALAVAGRDVGCRELARALDADPTVVNRVLGTLELLGLAQRTPGRKYRPGPGLHVLAAQSLQGSRLLPAALPQAEELLGEGFAVSVGVLWRDSFCFLLHVRPGQKLLSGIGTHELRPAENSSAGVALLAGRPETDWPEAARPAILAARTHGYAELSFPDGHLSLGTVLDESAGLAISRRFAGEAEKRAAAHRLQTAAAAIRDQLATGRSPAD